MGPSGPLAKLLAQHFTVFTYDRRGRGDSGDTAPYAVDREVRPPDAVAFYKAMANGGFLADELGFSFYPSSSNQPPNRLDAFRKTVEAARVYRRVRLSCRPGDRRRIQELESC